MGSGGLWVGEEEMGHPWVPVLHPPLVTLHIAPLAVFATVAIGVASHVHILEAGIWGWPGTCEQKESSMWDGLHGRPTDPSLEQGQHIASIHSSFMRKDHGDPTCRHSAETQSDSCCGQRWQGGWQDSPGPQSCTHCWWWVMHMPLLQ